MTISDGVEVVLRSVELYDLVKTALWSFWFRLLLRRLRSSKNWVVGVASTSGRTKPITKRGNVHYDWFIFPLLLPSPTIWFSLDRKRRSHKRSLTKIETFWFFRLRFRRAYDSAYDCNFWFSLNHKRENQRLRSMRHARSILMYYIIEAENLCLSPSTRKWEAGVFKNLHSGEKKDAFSVTVFTRYVWTPCRPNRGKIFVFKQKRIHVEGALKLHCKHQWNTRWTFARKHDTFTCEKICVAMATQ